MWCFAPGRVSLGFNRVFPFLNGTFSWRVVAPSYVSPGDPPTVAFLLGRNGTSSWRATLSGIPPSMALGPVIWAIRPPAARQITVLSERPWFLSRARGGVHLFRSPSLSPPSFLPLGARCFRTGGVDGARFTKFHQMEATARKQPGIRWGRGASEQGAWTGPVPPNSTKRKQPRGSNRASVGGVPSPARFRQSGIECPVGLGNDLVRTDAR